MANLNDSKDKAQRIFVLADTHNHLPQRVSEMAKGADEIWHLGDVCLIIRRSTLMFCCMGIRTSRDTRNVEVFCF